MTKARISLLLVLLAVLTFAAYRWTDGFGLRETLVQRFILNDIYSLIMIPDEGGACQAAIGYREKYVLGTFVAEPVKRMICGEYFFQDKPSEKYLDAPVVLVRLDNGEYHWVLESQLKVPVRQ